MSREYFFSWVLFKCLNSNSERHFALLALENRPKTDIKVIEFYLTNESVQMF